MRIAAAAAWMCAMAVNSAHATVIVEDFDDGVLDPAWQVTFENASGWSYSEQGTELTVTDVTTLASGWGRVNLERTVDLSGDFGLEWSFSWDEFGDPNAVQFVYLGLTSADDSYWTSMGLQDAWDDVSGRLRATATGATAYIPNYGTAPFSGDALMTVTREAGAVDIRIDGSSVVSASSNATYTKLILSFGYYEGPGNTFGTESVDRIAISIVPEPSTALLVAFFGAVARLRRRPKTGRRLC